MTRMYRGNHEIGHARAQELNQFGRIDEAVWLRRDTDHDLILANLTWHSDGRGFQHIRVRLDFRFNLQR